MHFPNGDMCQKCIHLSEDCSKLPFDKMPVIERYTDGDTMVKCTKYEKKVVMIPKDNGFSDTVGY